jgi:hypothetical protein
MNASTPPAIRIRRCFAAVTIATAVLLPGCANYQVRIADGKPTEPQYQGEMLSAYLWGTWASPVSMSAEKCKRGMYDVVVESNYLYSLATVVTLGIWMPVEVSYRCNAPPVMDGGVVPP